MLGLKRPSSWRHVLIQVSFAEREEVRGWRCANREMKEGNSGVVACINHLGPIYC